MHNLSKKVTQAASSATSHAARAVPRGPHHKTWNVYVTQQRHYKRAFVIGLVLGAAGASYVVLAKSQGAREELIKKVDELKVMAQENAVHAVDKVKPKIQGALSKVTEGVSQAASTVQDQAESVADRVEDLGSQASTKVSHTASAVKSTARKS